MMKSNDCEHVIVQHVASLFFARYFLTIIPNECTQDVEITCAIYQGLSDCARNMSEEKSTTRQGFICAEILPLRVLPHSP